MLFLWFEKKNVRTTRRNIIRNFVIIKCPPVNLTIASSAPPSTQFYRANLANRIHGRSFEGGFNFCNFKKFELTYEKRRLLRFRSGRQWTGILTKPTRPTVVCVSVDPSQCYNAICRHEALSIMLHLASVVDTAQWRKRRTTRFVFL